MNYNCNYKMSKQLPRMIEIHSKKGTRKRERESNDRSTAVDPPMNRDRQTKQYYYFTSVEVEMISNLFLFPFLLLLVLKVNQ